MKLNSNKFKFAVFLFTCILGFSNAFFVDSVYAEEITNQMVDTNLMNLIEKNGALQESFQNKDDKNEGSNLQEALEGQENFYQFYIETKKKEKFKTKDVEIKVASDLAELTNEDMTDLVDINEIDLGDLDESDDKEMKEQFAESIVEIVATPSPTPEPTPTPTPEPKVKVGDFPYEKGAFQGPWGDLTEYANQLSGHLGSCTRNLLPYVGLAPINEPNDNYSYAIDRWRDINGKGVVRYCQGGATAEDWNSLSPGDSTFVNSACGAYSTACVLSTMLGKYINVPEVAIAINTYNLRHPDSQPLALTHADGDGEGAFKHTDLAAVISEAGLCTEVADNFDVGKVDACLDKGGMVIYVVNGNYGGRFTRNAHYIVIREKTIYGYLVYSSTNWATPGNDDYCNTESTANELANLQGYKGAQMVFVTYPD